MDQLHAAVRQLLRFHPDVVRNYGCCDDDDAESCGGSPAARSWSGSDVPLAAPTAADGRGRRSSEMTEAAELLVTQLTAVLSHGLNEGLTLWIVLRTLERVPERLAASFASYFHAPPSVPYSLASRAGQGPTPSDGGRHAAATPPEAEAEAEEPPEAAHGSSTSPASGSPGRCDDEAASQTSQKSRIHRLNFASQIVFLINTALPHASDMVKARAFFRLALSQGCLLASLELLARVNADVVAGYMEVTPSRRPPSDRGTTSAAAGQSPSTRHPGDGMGDEPGPKSPDDGPETAAPAWCVLRQVDEATWDRFVAATAPVGGVMLEDIDAGAAKGPSVIRFDLKFVLPLVDDNRSYMREVERYVGGSRPTAPTIRECATARGHEHELPVPAEALLSDASAGGAAGTPPRGGLTTSYVQNIHVQGQGGEDGDDRRSVWRRTAEDGAKRSSRGRRVPHDDAATATTTNEDPDATRRVRRRVVVRRTVVVTRTRPKDRQRPAGGHADPAVHADTGRSGSDDGGGDAAEDEVGGEGDRVSSPVPQRPATSTADAHPATTTVPPEVQEFLEASKSVDATLDRLEAAIRTTWASLESALGAPDPMLQILLDA